MRDAARLAPLAGARHTCAILALAMAPSLVHAQAVGSSALASTGAKVIHPGYAQRKPITVSNVPASFSLEGLVLDSKTGKAVSGAAGKVSLSKRAAAAPSDRDFNNPGDMPNLPTIDGVDSLATFTGAFTTQAGSYAGTDIPYIMIGNDPRLGKTTAYPFNISEASLILLRDDGRIFNTVPFQAFEKPTLESPNFEPYDYRSGKGIEYADAIHRAEFSSVMKKDWHTVLQPHIKAKVNITVPYYVNVQLQDGTIVKARAYFTGVAPDGSRFVLMLDLLFNFFFDNEVVSEIDAGNFTTNGINTVMFPNTFLFSLNTSDPSQPGGCCTLGYHTYFDQPGVFPQPRWVSQYVSWISPGLFGGGFQDVTALSHETSEAFSDPFVNNYVAPWQFPGQPPASQVCQGNLENGDPIEGIGMATYPIEIKETDEKFDFVYHPQNIVLYQWFGMGLTSSAIDGAWSFPNEQTLTKSAVPCPQ